MKLILILLLFSFFGYSQTTTPKKSVKNLQKVQLHALLIFGSNCDISALNQSREYITSVFQENNVIIHEVKTWKEAISQSPKCHFFFYHGHGVFNPETKNFGGLLFNEWIKPEQIEKELVLRPGAVVIFDGVCGAAGSSADDTKDIGFAEARKRVLSTSSPYLKIGASVYFATNKGFLYFLDSFFSGKSIGDIQNETKSIFSYSGCDTILNEYIGKRRLTISSDRPEKGFATLVETSYKNGKKVTTTKKIAIFRDYDYALFGDEKFKVSDIK